MVPAERMSLAEVRDHLSEVVGRLEREHGRVVITKHGRPAAVVLSIEDLESLEETLEVLSNGTLLEDVRAGVGEVAAGGSHQLTRAEAMELVANR